MAGSVIPIIDIGRVLGTQFVSDDDFESLSEELCHAFSTVGFVYLTNHGIQQDKVDEVFRISKEFFRLPIEIKAKCAKREDSVHGWIGLERENLNPDRPNADLKEAFNVTPPEYSLWPVELPRFKDTLLGFHDTCKDLTYCILDLMSVGLNLENRHFLRDRHNLTAGEKNTVSTLRTLFYPQVPTDGSVKPGQARCGEHSDYGTVTLLFQDNIGGLEVQNTSGDYVPVTPVPGTVIVNVGDLMQRWTADRLKATKHRVLIPQEEFMKRQNRQSLAFFVQPNNDTLIECLDGSNKYPPITSLEYIKYRFSVTF